MPFLTVSLQLIAVDVSRQVKSGLSPFDNYV